MFSFNVIFQRVDGLNSYASLPMIGEANMRYGTEYQDTVQRQAITWPDAGFL